LGRLHEPVWAEAAGLRGLARASPPVTLLRAEIEEVRVS